MVSTAISRIDGVSTSTAIKSPVHAVATTNITLSGLQTVGGVTLDGDTLYRVLLTAQTDTTQNGIYDASTGSWTRSDDFDGAGDVVKGTIVVAPVSSPMYYYRVTSSNPIVPGTSAITFSTQTGLDTLIADLANGVAGLVGSTAIDYPQTAAELAASVTPVNLYIPSPDVTGYANVFRYGAKGDGSTDDTTAIINADKVNVSVFIPYTALGYKITNTVTFHNDVICEGVLNPTSAIGALTPDYNKFAVVIADSTYPIKRRIRGLKVQGSGALRTALVSGIRNDCPNSILEMCGAPQLDYGILSRAFSQTYLKCSAWQCNTNFDAYAYSTPSEFNALTIDGGNYDTPVNASLNLGDTHWSNALAAGNFHGVQINIVGGANFDGGPMIMDNVATVNIDHIYSEASNSGTTIQLGGSGDGNTRNVTIGGCFLKNAKYAIDCKSAVQGLTINPNYLNQITVSAVRMSSPLYGLTYRQQVTTGCFGLGQEVNINFGAVAISQVEWSNFTIEKDALINGIQYTCNGAQNKWYPGGIAYNGISAGSVQRHYSSTTCVFYTTPTTGKAGTMSGNVFTVTTLADCYSFSAGDRITTNVGGYTFISAINYETGAMTLQGGSGSAAVTINQVAASIRAELFQSAVPGSGTFAQGDITWFFASTSGAAPGACCTVGGSPGTWKNMANLA